MSAFNQHAYELFMQPFVQLMSNEYTAKLARDYHPMRMQRWALSDINPWLGWLAPAAGLAQTQRKAMDKAHPWRQLETMGSEFIEASLDYYRDVNNAMSEAAFFEIYGSLFALRHNGKWGAAAELPVVEPRELPVVQEALTRLSVGGFAEAAARIGFLLQRNGEPMPLSRLEIRAELAREYKDLLPEMRADELRRIRGQQEIIVRFEPEKAVAALPTLLANPQDRQRMVSLLDAVFTDERLYSLGLTREQTLALERVSAVIGYKVPALSSLVKRVAKAPVKASATKTALTAKKPAAAPKPAAKRVSKPAEKTAAKPAARKR